MTTASSCFVAVRFFIVSNIKEGDAYIGARDAGMFWHSDGPFLNTPHGPSALHVLEVPVQDDGQPWLDRWISLSIRRLRSASA
jgi:alpha-ketoglutarate-dependent taurine dioxygenase